MVQGSGSDRLLVSGCKLRFVLLISKTLFAFSILLTKSVANFCSSRVEMDLILMSRLREQKEVVGMVAVQSCSVHCTADRAVSSLLQTSPSLTTQIAMTD